MSSETLTPQQHNQQIIADWQAKLNADGFRAICIVGINDKGQISLLSTDVIALHDLSNILIEASDAAQNQLRAQLKNK